MYLRKTENASLNAYLLSSYCESVLKFVSGETTAVKKRWFLPSWNSWSKERSKITCDIDAIGVKVLELKGILESTSANLSPEREETEHCHKAQAAP